MRTANRFTNPQNSAYYDWPLNHDEESESGKSREISATSNTGTIGLVRQQGGETPYVLNLNGKILRRAQLVEFWEWFTLCKTQTIYFKDFDGQEYEGQITSFLPKRVRAINVGKDPQTHYWTYTMTFDVYDFRDGDMDDAGVPV